MMAVQTIPLRPVAAQEFNVVLGQQACTLKIYQKSAGLFMDVYLSGKPLIVGVLCRDRSRIIRSQYLGFAGDMYFVDTEGEADPYYAGLGSRWVLVYEVGGNGR